MPATFAHPAFAVPFTRLGLPLSGLVFGAMAPDLAYVLPVSVPYVFLHNVFGVFCFGLPVGLLAFVVYHRLVKAPLFGLFPRGLQARLTPLLAPPPLWPAPRLARVAAAVVVGAATHVAVDGFTHANGAFVAALPLLRVAPLTVLGHPVAVFALLQYGLTLVGTGLLVWWSRGALAHAWPTREDTLRLRYVALTALAVFALSAAHAWRAAAAYDGFLWWRVLTVQGVASALVLALSALVAHAAVVRAAGAAAALRS